MLEWKGISGYKERCTNGHYIKERAEEIRSALRKKGMKIDF